MKHNGQTIAICFFGITRSLRLTWPSIEKNMLEPARRYGDVQIYSHFFKQKQIANPRSGEQGEMDPNEHQLISSDWIELEEPNGCLRDWPFEELKAFGDTWDDDFSSLSNLIHQLHSLHKVTSKILAGGHDTAIFLRPDLRYLDSGVGALRAALKTQSEAVWLPSWQAWGGVNDRFAICRGRRAIRTYGQRAESALAFCQSENMPLQGEQMLAWSLKQQSIPIYNIKVRASRIRLDGSVATPDLFPSAARRIAARWATQLGVKEQINRALGRDSAGKRPKG